MEQSKPPDIPFFDNNHMKEVEDYVNNYSNNEVECSINHDLCNAPITTEEVELHLHKLKNNKAAGYDNLIGEFLKYSSEDTTLALCALFNKIFDVGEWPENWSIGLISPIHKKESINICDNYRKITVMPVIGRVLESILNTRLIYKNSITDIDDPLQFGFKQN